MKPHGRVMKGSPTEVGKRDAEYALEADVPFFVLAEEVRRALHLGVTGISKTTTAVTPACGSLPPRAACAGSGPTKVHDDHPRDQQRRH